MAPPDKYRASIKALGILYFMLSGNHPGAPCVHLDRKEGLTLADWDEQALIARLRVRDLEALGELFQHLGGAMSTLARSILRDSAEADDVVEEALLRIHGAGPGFRGERGLRTWCLRIIANLCRDKLRRRKFSAGPPEELSPLQQLGLSVDPVADWDVAIDHEVVAAALERAIARLAPDHREAVVMRYRLGLSEAEMSDALGVPQGTVKSRLSRAMVVLRDAMKELGA